MKAAIYARVSTRDKGQDNENQLRELRAFAERLGYSVYKEYTDQDSGSKADREAFKQIFLDTHQRRFDVIIFWALDRFSREDVAETLGYLQNLSASGVQFKSFTEQYLDSTGILAAIAKQEQVRLSERTEAGLVRARLKGTKIGRPAVDTALVAQMKRLKKGGASDRSIGRTLGLSPNTVAKYAAS